MTQQRSMSPIVHLVFLILLNRTTLPSRQETEGNLGLVFKAFIIDGYTGTAKWELKIGPTESYSRKNVYCINKGINHSGPKSVKSLNSQGVKALNFVSIKATEIRKGDDSLEVTTSGVAGNYAGETSPLNSSGVQRGTRFLKICRKKFTFRCNRGSRAIH